VEATFITNATLDEYDGDLDWSDFRLADGKELSLMGSAGTEKLKKGAKVSITYQKEQWWNPFSGECSQDVFLKSVKPLPATSKK
jgi:hypothetical protein